MGQAYSQNADDQARPSHVDGDDDVVGHTSRRVDGDDDLEGHTSRRVDGDDDVEGHVAKQGK